MKAFFIRDNTDKFNWGARATSSALREIISRNHQITFSIGGNYLSRWYPEGTRISHSQYQRLCRKLFRQKLLRTPGIGPVAGGVLNGLGRPRGLTHDFDHNIALLREYARFDEAVAAMLRGLDEAEVVIANVEGDGIFRTEPRRHFLMMMTLAALAQELQKPVFFVNGMLSADPQSGINEETITAAAPVFEKSRLVALREAASKSFADEWFPRAPARTVADALFVWQPRVEAISELPRDRSALWPYAERSGWQVPTTAQAGRYIAVGGSSAAAWDQKSARVQYAELVRSLKKLGLPLVLVQTCEGDAFLESVATETDVPFVPVDIPVMAGAALLARAEVFVSGRWHPSIMATLGGTPCVFMGSNSHKTRSLQEQIGYPRVQEYAAIPSTDEIEAIVEDVEAVFADSSRRSTILAKARELSAEAASLSNLLV